MLLLLVMMVIKFKLTKLFYQLAVISSAISFPNVTKTTICSLATHQQLNAFLETVQELKVTGFQTVEDENKSNLDVSEKDLYSKIDIPHEDTQVHRTIVNDTFNQDLTTIPSETKIIVPVEN